MLSSRGNTEYVIVIILVLAAVIVLLTRYSGSLRGRFTDASGQVSTTEVGKGLEEAALSREEEEGFQERVVPAEARGDGKVRLGALEFDLQTILWLGIGVLALSALMMMQIFRAARPDPKDKKGKRG